MLDDRNLFLLSLCATTCSVTACFRLNSKSLTCALFCNSSYCRHASRLVLYKWTGFGFVCGLHTVRVRLGLG